MKKYLRLQCSVCLRTTDRLVDITHVTTDKCTITLQCSGVLSNVGYLSNGMITSTPEVGVLDWQARGTKTNLTAELHPEVLIDTSTGTLGQIVLAVRGTSTAPVIVTLSQQTDAPKSFSQYIYRFENAFKTIAGVESGLEKKALRFGGSDVVEVFVNGIKMEQGTAPENYQIYGETMKLQNTVSFNEIISNPGVTQVDVVVSKAVPSTEVQVPFVRNTDDESRLLLGAWENVSALKVLEADGAWTDWSLYSIDLDTLSTLIKLNSIFTVLSASQSGTVVPLSNIKMVLARKPYSQLDRYINLCIPLSELNSSSSYLKYTAADRVPVLLATSTAITPNYPPFKVQKFNVERTIKTFLPGNSSQVIADTTVVIGPDV